MRIIIRIDINEMMTCLIKSLVKLEEDKQILDFLERDKNTVTQEINIKNFIQMKKYTNYLK